uniref:Putative secreted protein n=1 Tax=Anopheles darlingi TaxID=43151 RepID=A0A2M4DAG1_ANODA
MFVANKRQFVLLLFLLLRQTGRGFSQLTAINQRLVTSIQAPHCSKAKPREAPRTQRHTETSSRAAVLHDIFRGLITASSKL